MISAIAAAADPGAVVARALKTVDRPTHLLSIGKAGVEMARAASEVYGPLPGMVVGPDERVSGWASPPPLCLVFRADHPKPTVRNTHAAERVLAWCESLCAEDRLLVLISGGASAQLSLPIEGASLATVSRVSDVLMRAGADIRELNSVRKRLDRIKGGRLAVAVAPASSEVLVLSDVLGDPLDVVSSGPMCADRSTRDEVLGVLEKYGASDTAAADLILAGGPGVEPPGEDDSAFALMRHRVIGNHETLARAAVECCQREGYEVKVRTMVAGEASEVGRDMAERWLGMCAASETGRCALVFAGETTVSGVPMGVRGGPVQEAVLAGALWLRAAGAKDWCLVGYASDGVDGPTDAAGAVLSDVSEFDDDSAGESLGRHDVYGVLDSVGALVRTGPTGTNLNDVLVVWQTDGAEEPIGPGT